MVSPKTATTALLAAFGVCAHLRSAAQKYTCFTNPNLIPSHQDHGLEAYWKEYLVFTVSRNPLARAHSAYMFLHDPQWMNVTGRHRSDIDFYSDIGADSLDIKQQCYVPWRSFCADPYAIVRLCDAEPACCKG